MILYEYYQKNERREQNQQRDHFQFCMFSTCICIADITVSDFRLQSNLALINVCLCPDKYTNATTDALLQETNFSSS